MSRRLNSTILGVVERHAEEAAILWLQRDDAVYQPHFRLEDLARLDERLHANLDGLRIAGDDGWEVCCAELTKWHEPGEIFAAAVIAWESGKARRVQKVIQALARCDQGARALVSSLGWLGADRAGPHVLRLLAGASPVVRRIGIAASAALRRDPGDALTRSVGSRDKLLRARALRAIGKLSRRDLLPAVRQALRSRDPHVRFSAAWSIARLEDDEGACSALRKAVESGAAGQGSAMQLVLRRMEPSGASNWLNRWSQNSSLVRQAVIGTGVVGLPDAVGWLIEMMAVPAVARVAGEAFTMITGLDLVEAKMEEQSPADFAAGPTEDPKDDNVALDPDENLPWPEAGKIAAWWQAHHGDFLPGVRHLCGRPITEDLLEHVLRQGYQRQRAAAALELALLRPDQPLFNVRAPGHRQQELLGLR